MATKVPLLIHVSIALCGTLLALRGASGQGFWTGLMGLAIACFLVFVGLRALEATVKLARGLPASF